jgi:hypothetical protein
LGNALHFAPVAEAVFCPEHRNFPDAAAFGDGFNMAYLTDDLKFHS